MSGLLVLKLKIEDLNGEKVFRVSGEWSFERKNVSALSCLRGRSIISRDERNELELRIKNSVISLFLCPSELMKAELRRGNKLKIVQSW